MPASLGALLHRVTDGSPLFLVAMVEALVARRVLTAHDGCWTLQVDKALAYFATHPDTVLGLFGLYCEESGLTTQTGRLDCQKQT